MVSTGSRTRGYCSSTLLALVAAATLMPSTALAQDMPDYPGVDEMPPISIRVSDGYAQEAASGKAQQAFADYVTAASKGKITVEIFWSSTLFPPPESAEGIASGLADMGIVSPIYDPASFPIANWLTTIANQATVDMPLGVGAFDAASTEFFYTDTEVKREFEERGLHIIGASGSFGLDLMCDKPLRTLADFQGKRIRTPGQVFARETQAIGMIPVPLAPGEVFEGFQRGIVECIVLHPPGYNTFGIMSISKDKYFMNLAFSGFLSNFYSMNKAKWDALPPVAQRILTDGYLVYREVSNPLSWAEIQLFGTQIADGLATAIQPEPEVVEALAAFQAQDLANMQTTAPSGVADPRATVDRYLALIQKWRGLLQDELGWSPIGNDVVARVESWKTVPDYKAQMVLIKRELAKATPAM